jgi:GNAT superfamily N-acetyltransferase
MPIVLDRPTVDALSAALGALREWQSDGAPMQLHPGDLGWHWRFGAEATAAAVRVWRRDGEIVAVGLQDEPELVRLAVQPVAQHDAALSRRLLADLIRPARGMLPAGRAAVEARSATRLGALLLGDGWVAGESWTPLSRDLATPVEPVGMRIEAIGPARAGARAAVQRAAFDRSTFTEDRWHAMAAGPAYADARCLVAYDEARSAVAAATVWSAGAGRPGLLEPMGVHRDHRGLGYGTAITVAAAAALRELGSSVATVCTPSSNVGAIATYRSAGFRPLPPVADLQRTA